MPNIEEENFKIFLDLSRKYGKLVNKIIQDSLLFKGKKDLNKRRQYIERYKHLTGKSLSILLGKIKRGKLKLEDVLFKIETKEI